MSYQAEERYWTDYLRIALPIAGLLLLLGVFWYWATSFIGDDNENPLLTPEAAVALTPLTADTPTPTSAAAVAITPQVVQPTPTQQAALPTQQTSDSPTETTSADAGDEGTFVEGDIAIVNDDDVNMRSDPTVGGDIVDTLVQGTELRILSGEFVEADGYVWWNVEDILNEQTGWVAEDFIDPQ